MSKEDDEKALLDQARTNMLKLFIEPSFQIATHQLTLAQAYAALASVRVPGIIPMSREPGLDELTTVPR